MARITNLFGILLILSKINERARAIFFFLEHLIINLFLYLPLKYEIKGGAGPKTSNSFEGSIFTFIFLQKSFSFFSFFEINIKEHNFYVAGWRDVPINTDTCGKETLKTMPHIAQSFINPSESLAEENVESELFVIRRKIEIEMEKENDDVFYIPSFSSKVILSTFSGIILSPNFVCNSLSLASDLSTM